LINQISSFLIKFLHPTSSTGQIIAHHETEAGITAVNASPANLSKDKGFLPKNNVILQPGIYRLWEHRYDCSQPGIYRFSIPIKENLQRVVLDPSSLQANIQFLSLLSIRGNCDNRSSFAQKVSNSSRRFLRMTCTYNSLFISEILSCYGFSTRLVQGHTLDALNAYNNGHSLLEFYSTEQKKFIVVDVDKKGFFLRNGAFLNLFDLCKAIHGGDKIEFLSFAKSAMLDFRFADLKTSFDYSFLEYPQYASSEGILKGVMRTCQFPIIKDCGQGYACSWEKCDEELISRINPNWKILNPSSFFEKFYNQPIS
jgi:hypothetical protein